MTVAAIIGGSGLTELKSLQIIRRETIRTPYGEPSAPLVFGELGGKEVIFLPRHGSNHNIPPHEINYRANLWAVKETGVSKVIAVAAVGAISNNLSPGELAIPDQIIDYTYGRAQTYFESGQKGVTHVDFTDPYCEELRRILIEAARRTGIAAVERATYAATQGPRFESAAEIRRLEKDGADIVGMTGMPEAGLARELGLCYATIAVVVNPAAGKVDKEINLSEIEQNLEIGMIKVRALLEAAIPLLASKTVTGN